MKQILIFFILTGPLALFSFAESTEANGSSENLTAACDIPVISRQHNMAGQDNITDTSVELHYILSLGAHIDCLKNQELGTTLEEEIIRLEAHLEALIVTLDHSRALLH